MDNDHQKLTPQSPLLGTSLSQDIENIVKLPLKGPINRVCYTGLLRDSASKSLGNPEKTAKNGVRNCYGKLLRKMPCGMFLRGGQFYYRKTVPQDVFRLIGKAEIWRSLRTDSFQIAAHRLPMVMANIESQIENVRLKAGFQCDHYLLKGLKVCGWHQQRPIIFRWSRFTPANFRLQMASYRA